MKRIMLFEEFLNEAKDPQDLHKIYLCINPESGHRWWSYKDFAGSKFFTQVTLENYKDIDINPEYPVLNYNSEVCKKLLEEGNDVYVLIIILQVRKKISLIYLRVLTLRPYDMISVSHYM